MATIADDPDKQGIRKIMRKGMDSEFWRIMMKAIDENIEIVDRVFLYDMRTKFVELNAEECKVQMMTYLAEKAYLEQLKDLPLSIIGEVSEIKTKPENVDVYSKAEDFIPKKDDV